MKQLTISSRFLFIVSLVMLSILFTVYSELFLFSKNVEIPYWITMLPEPFSLFGFPGFTRISIFICLLPIFFAKEKTLASGLLLMKIVFLSIVPVLIIYSFEIIPKIEGYRAWFNLSFQYFWIVCFHCLIPLCALFFFIYLKNSLGKQDATL